MDLRPWTSQSIKMPNSETESTDNSQEFQFNLGLEVSRSCTLAVAATMCNEFSVLYKLPTERYFEC